jgi:hypothetical protein
MFDGPAVFLSEEDIVNDMLLYRLSEREKLTLRSISGKDVKDLCAELSEALITHYRLNDKNNPYTTQDTMHDNYPIKVSYRIVATTWSRLTGKPIPSAQPTPDPIDLAGWC